MPVPLWCANCDFEEVALCTDCKAIAYCCDGNPCATTSPLDGCQGDDWPFHKLLCHSYAAYADEYRPSPNHLRAILFNAKANKPQLVWLEAHQLEPVEDSLYSNVNLLDHVKKFLLNREELQRLGQEGRLGRNTRWEDIRAEFITVNYNNGALLPYNCMIQIFSSKTPNCDERRNEAVVAAGMAWYDAHSCIGERQKSNIERFAHQNVIATALDGDEQGITGYTDMDLAHYRSVIDWIVSYNPEWAEEDLRERHLGICGYPFECQTEAA
jgi:hypothetical protein